MTLVADVAPYVIAAAFCGVVAWAALSDIRTRRIPNRAVLALLVLFLPWSLAAGGENVLPALAAAGIALIVTIALWQFGIIGAGDSKMFAAVALFIGLDNLPALALLTVLGGGVLALGSFASRPRRALAMVMLRGRGDWGRGVPYGVPIAVAGAVAICTGLFGVTPQLVWRDTITAAEMAKAMEEWEAAGAAASRDAPAPVAEPAPKRP